VPKAAHRSRLFEGTVEDLSARGSLHGAMCVCTDGDSWAAGDISAPRDEDLVLADHGSHGRCPSQSTETKLMRAEYLGGVARLRMRLTSFGAVVSQILAVR
jgi:TPP-dependent pyruvate/acetoin dehydrogenase alpha subunit